MKSLFLFFLILGISNLSFAQNYELIHPNRVAHFKHQEEILSIRIDSVNNSAGTTHYYNHKVLTRHLTTPSPCLLTETDSSWIGHQITMQPNGEYTFFNQKNESIVIQSLAELNDKWTLYTWTNNNYIEATLTSIDTMTVLGLLDSIKTITLQAKNSTIAISHSINNQQIKFSKHHGLIDFYAIPNFPDTQEPYHIVGASNPNLGISNLTAADIFNYNIGDEFHVRSEYRSSSSPWIYNIQNTRRIVLGKATSNNLDTIQYSIQVCNNNYNNTSQVPNPDTTITIDTIQEVIILSELNHLNQLSYEVLSDSSTYSTFLIDAIFNKRAKRLDGQHYQTGSNCWNQLIGNTLPFYSYLDGLGGPYYENPSTVFGAHNKQLVYYAKSGDTWGTPLDIDCNIGTTVPKIAQDQSSIRVFPNPFHQETTISIDNFSINDQWLLKIYDAMGKELKSQNINNQDFILDRKNLTNGMYFYRLHNNAKNKLYTGKIILQ
ncbi:T9SS type A sorting domain-containing protein [Aureispira anguillae]|uniref:T9SS type A sorting domain-containing protein n=1 Tax=Aureispira anguillae TaxID=2864201 RepID=A0A915YDC2_9BACT|nr:T9SS type A sorting domain-containing protein [Aureispira anguillae]BDS11012.1 T9SS type A sorting domain-containing protein [Aureispira anguillae]